MDFPYFRRLFNSIVVALLAASFIPLLVIGGGMYYHTVSILEQKTLTALDAEIDEHREAIRRHGPSPIHRYSFKGLRTGYYDGDKVEEP
jgi:hypothetical protein